MGLIVTVEMVNRRLVSEGKDAKLIGPYQKSKIKSLFECSMGHTWMATPDNVLRRSGCPECFLQNHKLRSVESTHTKEDMNSYLLSENRGIILIGDYINNATKTLFQCSLGHRWEAVPRNIKTGRGCPRCANHGFNPNKAAWEYCFIRNGYLKYGITNNLIQRLKIHRRYGDFTIVHEHYHDIGQVALDWENNIKKNYGGRYVTADDCPDGWTETLPVEMIEYIRG